MAVTLTYQHVRNEAFVKALAKLARFEGFKDFRVAYSIAKFVRKWEQEAQMAQELYLKLVKQYAKLDEKGNVEPVENQPGTFQIPNESVEVWKQAAENFHTISFEIEVKKLPISKLEAVGLSAMELNALEPLLEIDFQESDSSSSSDASLALVETSSTSVA